MLRSSTLCGLRLQEILLDFCANAHSDLESIFENFKHLEKRGLRSIEGMATSDFISKPLNRDPTEFILELLLVVLNACHIMKIATKR